MLKGLALIFLAPWVIIASLIIVPFGLAIGLGILGAFSHTSSYDRTGGPDTAPKQGRLSHVHTTWTSDLRSDPAFCAWLGDFAALTAKHRDAGWGQMDVVRSLDDGPKGRVYAVMQAIILDVYSDPLLSPAVAKETTTQLCLLQKSQRY